MEKSSLNGTRRTVKLPDAEGGSAILARSALSGASREILSLEVECGSRAPAVVRAALSRVRELGAAQDDVILVASELVTNAVVHSGALPGDTIHVRALLGRGRVSISVQDPGLSGDSPRVRGPDGLQPEGWGLRIVKELAECWGFERDRGHRVWAELCLPLGERVG